jgi:hypothetical protein
VFPLAPARFFGTLGLCLAVGAALPPTALAQEGDGTASLQIDRASGTATLEVGDLLGEGRLQEALQEGLPLRVRARIELWRDGFFDNQQGVFEWRMNVIRDPLGAGFLMVGPGPPRQDRDLASLDALRGALATSLVIPLQPIEEGRYYFLGWVEVETLSLSDLEELQRWMEGDLGRVLTGDRAMDQAFERGVGRLLVRALGLPTRRVRVQTPTFSFEGRDPNS